MIKQQKPEPREQKSINDNECNVLSSEGEQKCTVLSCRERRR